MATLKKLKKRLEPKRKSSKGGKNMSLRGFDKHARRVMAASLDWWNSTTNDSITDLREDVELLAKLEHDLELGKELFLELTGHEWSEDCPYLDYIKD